MRVADASRTTSPGASVAVPGDPSVALLCQRRCGSLVCVSGGCFGTVVDHTRHNLQNSLASPLFGRPGDLGIVGLDQAPFTASNHQNQGFDRSRQNREWRMRIARVVSHEFTIYLMVNDMCFWTFACEHATLHNTMFLPGRRRTLKR